MKSSKKKNESSFVEALLNNSYRGLTILLLVCALIFILLATLLLILFSNFQKNVAEFGSAINIVSALFNALALGALFYTILLQQRELKETREEFKKQSTEFQKQTRSAEEHTQILKDQRDSEMQARNDDKFFKLFDNYLKHKEILYSQFQNQMNSDIHLMSDAEGKSIELALSNIKIQIQFVSESIYYQIYYENTFQILKYTTRTLSQMFEIMNFASINSPSLDYNAIFSSQLSIQELRRLYYHSCIYVDLEKRKFFKSFFRKNLRLVETLSAEETDLLNSDFF